MQTVQSETVFDAVQMAIANSLSIEPEKITRDSRFAEDLELEDSSFFNQVFVFIGRATKIKEPFLTSQQKVLDQMIADFPTVGSVCEFVEKLKKQ